MDPRRTQALLAFIRPFRRRILWLLALTGVLSILAMAPPLLLRSVINDVITDGDRTRLPQLAFFMVLVPALAALCGYLQVLGVAFVGQKFVMNLRHAVYEHLLRLSMRFFGKHSVGMIVNRVMGDTMVMQQVLTVAAVQVLADLVSSAFAITVTFSLNWRLATLLLGFVVLFVINYRANIAAIRTATRGYRSAEDRMASGVQNRLVANLTVRTFGAEAREQEAFRLHSDQTLGLVQSSQDATNRFTMNTMLLRDIGRTVIYFLGCALVLRDEASYGDVIAFTTYAMQLLAPAVRFSSLAQQLQDVSISTDRIFELLDEEAEIPPNEGVPASRIHGNVEFDHVGFWYEEGTPVLHDLSFSVKEGETIALVGPTGCGKSTILSLLLRFFDVTGGAVLVDGQDIREMNVASLRRQFGIVLQESLLFNVTIADNIRYSRPTATREQIEEAARIAEIDDVIQGLPGGYDARVGGQDVQLSVGQKQRLSIARAVLANPAILIMDEATSALDSESERAVQAAMDRFLVGRTSFIVAHRLSTIRNADRIILLDKGAICEMGSHDELMGLPNGRYRSLYEKHAGKGVLEDD